MMSYVRIGRGKELRRIPFMVSREICGDLGDYM